MKEDLKKMLQRKLLLKPCFRKLLSDFKKLLLDFNFLKQGFNFTKRNNVKIKPHFAVPKRLFTFAIRSINKMILNYE